MEIRTALFFLLLATAPCTQTSDFRWVNPMPEGAHECLEHGTYHSELMDLDVGYVAYLPPGYGDPADSERSYPVVYFLAGGRVGSEVKSIALAGFLDEWIQSEAIQPRIFVFVNGGPEGYFDYGESRAESSFIQELIPHIDRTYRTTSDRSGRALEGFSMGGRAVARIMFKFPEMFCSAAPLSGGHQKEKDMSDAGGEETRGPNVLVHDPDNNSWDLARAYAEHPTGSDLEILVGVGSADMNYQGNMAWMDHLRALDITFEQLIPPDIPHNPLRFFESVGPAVEEFHDRCFASASTGGA